MFNATNIEESKEQTVGVCNGIPAKTRWDVETTVFSEIILSKIEESGACRILDYGCGSGRLAKPLLESNRNIEIVGIDSSPQMRQLAQNYVLSDRFSAFAPKEFNSGARFDFAYCIYCLQHIPLYDLLDTIDFLADHTDTLLLVNSVCRMAVQNNSFTNDSVNVLNLVQRKFKNFQSALPWNDVVHNPVIRQMFLEGATLHYAVWCKK